jgi:hypothetical protein
MVMLDGWDCFFSLPKHKKGASVFSRGSGTPFTVHSIFQHVHSSTERFRD